MIQTVEFRETIPIIEGKLYDYGRLKVEYPDARISNAYRKVIITGSGPPESEQERWIRRHEAEIRDAFLIKKVIRNLSETERQLVFLRYAERWTWRKVADKLHVSEREVYRMRDRVLAVFAYEFGLLTESGSQAS